MNLLARVPEHEPRVRRQSSTGRKPPLDTILDLEHPDRRRFLREADALAGHVTHDPQHPEQ